MHRDASPGRAFAFGSFLVEPATKLLMENGAPVPIGSRAFEVLLALIARAGDVVPHDELVARVWPQTVVEETSLRVHVSALRRALRDGQAGARWVINVPGRGYSFVGELRPVAGREAMSSAPSDYALPRRLTRIVGRETLIARLGETLAQRRFVTLVGAGGMGKTTVALAVAERRHAEYEHGARFVDLSTLTDPLRVRSLLDAVLDISEDSRDHLPPLRVRPRDCRMLVILDNCEHVIEAAAELAEGLLRAAPGVAILATSREPLAAEAEWVHRIEGLAVPANSLALSCEEALAWPAIDLFVERTGACCDGFELDDGALPLVRRTCARLDGMPLAIELAAARVDTLGLPGLVERLDDLFEVLIRGRRTALPRHRTLQALFDWSHDLLGEADRLVFRRLALFRASFTLESAVAVAAFAPLARADVMQSVPGLAARSLVAVDTTARSVRYALPGVVRAYACRRLVDSDDEAVLSRRHAEHVRDLLETASPALHDTDFKAWMATFGPLAGDVRAATEWAFSPSGDDLLGISLVIASTQLAFELGLWEDYRVRVELSLARLHTLAAPHPLLVFKLHASMCLLAGTVAEPPHDVEALFEHTLELARPLEAQWQLFARFAVGVGSFGLGDFRRLRAVARSAALIAAGDTETDHSFIDHHLTFVEHYLGTQSRAWTLAQALLDTGNLRSRGFLVRRVPRAVSMNILLARILWLQGRADEAQAVARRALASAAETHPFSLGQALAMGVIPIAFWRGDDAQAAHWCRVLEEQVAHEAQSYWTPWVAGFREALGRRAAGPEATHAEAIAPRNAMLGDLLGTLHESMATAACQARVDTDDVAWCGPEILRASAERLLRSGAPDATTQAEALLERARHLAEERVDRAWALRIAISLARLWRAQGRAQEAVTLLERARAAIEEGRDDADMRRAAALVAALRGGACPDKGDASMNTGIAGDARLLHAFGDFELHAPPLRLSFRRRDVPLAPSALALLAMLAGAKGDLVPSATAWSALSRDADVDDSRLGATVADINRALATCEPTRACVAEICAPDTPGFMLLAPDARQGSRPSLPPPPPTVIGRDDAIERIVEQLLAPAFVTVVGTGGLGKTTVALAAAARLAPRLADGACFVELAPLLEGRRVADAVAHALGLADRGNEPLAALRAGLAGREMLVVLDGCEHVLDAAAEVAEALLQAGDGIRVLATSREPLRAAAERQHRLAPMALPPVGASLAAYLAPAWPALALFAQRAAAADPRFRLDDGNIDAVAALCRRVDGIPLAIEIVAARAGEVGVQALAEQLEEHLLRVPAPDAGGPARHRTLRALLDWSWAFLTPTERATLRRLSVFRGTFTPEAALAAVVDEEFTPALVRESVADLVAKSLVTAVPPGDGRRLRLLDTTRAYAGDMLAGSIDQPATHRRHATFVLAHLRAGLAEGEALPRERWLERYAPWIDDVRAAVDWMLGQGGDAGTGLELIMVGATLARQLCVEGEFNDRFDRALGVMANLVAPPSREPGGAATTPSRAAPARDPRQQEAMILAALERGQAGRTPESEMQLRIAVLSCLWVPAIMHADFAAARDWSRRIASVTADDGPPPARLIARRKLAQSLHFMGEHAEACQHAWQALADSGQPIPLVYMPCRIELRVSMRIVLARALWMQGRPGQALAMAREAVRQARTDSPLAQCQALAMGLLPVAIWSGAEAAAVDAAEALRATATAASLKTWRRWGERCAELLARRGGDTSELDEEPDWASDADANLADHLASFDPRWLGRQVVGRVEAGFVGWCAPEVMRLQAERLAAAGRREAAEASCLQALALAHRHQAHGWALRAATTLGRLRRAGPRAPQATSALAAALGRIEQDIDTPDRTDATRLLAELGA